MSYTLNVAPETLSLAERFARRRGSSLENIIKEYVIVFVEQELKQERLERRRVRREIPECVSSLRGAVRLNDNRPYKDILADELIKRYEVLT